MKDKSRYIELLIEMKKYIEATEESVDGEWGECRGLQKIIDDGDMPNLYNNIINTLEEVNHKFWQEPNDCPYCNLPNSELDYDSVEENDGSKHDVVDCPRCKARLFHED